MGQGSELRKSDAGKRLDFICTDCAALDAAEDEGGQCPGGGGFIHDAACGLLNVVPQPGCGCASTSA